MLFSRYASHVRKERQPDSHRPELPASGIQFPASAQNLLSQTNLRPRALVVFVLSLVGVIWHQLTTQEEEHAGGSLNAFGMTSFHLAPVTRDPCLHETSFNSDEAAQGCPFCGSGVPGRPPPCIHRDLTIHRRRG